MSGSLPGAFLPKKAKKEEGEHKETDFRVEPIPLRGKTEGGEGHANHWIDEEQHHADHDHAATMLHFTWFECAVDH